jgi:hypothetical protein
MQYIFENDERERWRNSWRLGAVCVRYAIENNLSLDWERDWWIYNAAINGELDLLKWLYAHGCRWNVDHEAGNNGRCVYDRLIGYNRLECLKFVVEKDIENGYAPGLDFLRKCGCNLACQDGHLRILKYLHENGIGELRELSYACCEDRDNIDCFRYLHENGCPWGDRSKFKYGDCAHRCITYATERGLAIT